MVTKVTEEYKLQIVDRVLLTMKYAEESEWTILYEYITNLQNEVEEKETELTKLKKEMQDLKEDISSHYHHLFNENCIRPYHIVLL